MRNDQYQLPLTPKAERLHDQACQKSHSTQKPEVLLYRVIVASTKPSHLILDPFFSNSTSGEVAKRLHRDWIGIELEQDYIDLVQLRIAAAEQEEFNIAAFDIRSPKKMVPRIPFSALLENNYIHPGQQLFFYHDRSRFADIKPDTRLVTEDWFMVSIHSAGTHYQDGYPCNGWEHCYLEKEGRMFKLDELRQRLCLKFHETYLTLTTLSFFNHQCPDWTDRSDSCLCPVAILPGRRRLLCHIRGGSRCPVWITDFATVAGKRAAGKG